MSNLARKKEHPLSMRLPESDIAVIDRAAALRGRSRTEFMRDAAVRAAEEALMENTLLRMSPQAFKHFMAVIVAPAKPVPELLKLFKRKAPWEAASKRR